MNIILKYEQCVCNASDVGASSAVIDGHLTSIGVIFFKLAAMQQISDVAEVMQN